MPTRPVLADQGPAAMPGRRRHPPPSSPSLPSSSFLNPSPADCWTVHATLGIRARQGPELRWTDSLDRMDRLHRWRLAAGRREKVNAAAISIEPGQAGDIRVRTSLPLPLPVIERPFILSQPRQCILFPGPCDPGNPHAPRTGTAVGGLAVSHGPSSSVEASPQRLTKGYDPVGRCDDPAAAKCAPTLHQTASLMAVSGHHIGDIVADSARFAPSFVDEHRDRRRSPVHRQRAARGREFTTLASCALQPVRHEARSAAPDPGKSRLSPPGCGRSCRRRRRRPTPG